VASLLFDLLVIMLGELKLVDSVSSTMLPLQRRGQLISMDSPGCASLVRGFHYYLLDLWLTVDMKQTLIFTTATVVKAYFMTPTKFFIFPYIDRAMVLLSVTMVCWNPQSIQTK
jgi:hypothetical protein